MFSIKFFPNMLYLILLLQYNSYILQDCAAAETGSIADKAIVTSVSSPILKHLLKTEILDSNSRTVENVHGSEMHNKELENLIYKLHKHLELKQEEKVLNDNFNIDVLEMKRNSHKEGVDFKSIKADLSKLIAAKLANAFKKQLQFMFAKTFPKYSIKSNSSKFDSDMTSESNDTHSMNVPNSSASISDEISSSVSKPEIPTARQFVFHPYLPYGKDVVPDEKISIEDVLPVKMVKFFKSMVEDAPWEQMFMKMVRMIVDQFVDKIIEKMFAHKEDHDEWRSTDGGSAKPTWSLAKNVLTYVVRSRRSTEGKAKSDHVQDWIEKDPPSANRVSKEDRAKTKEPTEEESWLDSVLDYLFPDDPKAGDSEKDERKRRDTDKPLQDTYDQVSGIMRSFLGRYLKFQPEQLAPESINGVLKESIRHKMFDIFSQDNSKLENSKLSIGANSSMSKNIVSDTALEDKVTESLNAPEKSSVRTKRSTADDTDKDKEEEERLWQANRRTRPSHRKTREDCSLRRACNAGRLLSRLPSVQDITMQLKAYGNEPHWDALLWGMTKKRCSRIFCKRQRSPKGTKHHWDEPEKRFHRKGTTSFRSSRLRYDESDLTTIFPV
ncbi:uncharacterized protein LOC129969371 [Argiope bruennichi]|uniref:uncharacterized protein LOC129969371 n=1 Tax=Argiope bruennichi TaxID=94029 RepID=UPI0024944E59|nr:uncharacterized protein LOC129969371 [Argiope bruennichi]